MARFYWSERWNVCRLRRRRLSWLDDRIRGPLRPAPPRLFFSASLHQQQRCVAKAGLPAAERIRGQGESWSSLRTLASQRGWGGAPAKSHTRTQPASDIQRLASGLSAAPSSWCRISSSGSFGSAVWPGRWAGFQRCHVQAREKGPAGTNQDDKKTYIRHWHVVLALGRPLRQPSHLFQRGAG